MQAFKTIICALDLGSQSAVVADYALTLARAFDAEILVVHATPPLTQYAAFEVQPKAIEKMSGEISAGAVQLLEQFMEKNFPGVKASSRVAAGDPAEEILRLAREIPDAVIVMGTRGLLGVQRLVFGSVAESVVKNAAIPVLTVPPQ